MGFHLSDLWAVAIGLGSVLLLANARPLIEWARAQTVKHSQPVTSSPQVQTEQTKQTDEANKQDSIGLSVADQWLDRLEVDRTRTALIELMVYSGWKTGEIRSVIKGDTGAIGQEVVEARKRLGVIDPERTLVVRDQQGEREIALV